MSDADGESIKAAWSRRSRCRRGDHRGSDRRNGTWRSGAGGYLSAAAAPASAHAVTERLLIPTAPKRLLVLVPSAAASNVAATVGLLVVVPSAACLTTGPAPAAVATASTGPASASATASRSHGERRRFCDDERRQAATRRETDESTRRGRGRDHIIEPGADLGGGRAGRANTR